MTVSVCIPTYNSEKYLRECIDSVLAQTWADFELIISDNASTDGTCDIVRAYSDPRIQLHRFEPFAGMAANFNHAASLARGKFVKFLCYDDVIEPTCLAKQVAMLERHAAMVLATSGLRYMDAEGKTIGELSLCAHDAILSDVEVIAGNLTYGNLIGLPSAALIRRQSLNEAGPFSDAFPEMLDVEMYLRLIRLGPVGYLPERLCSCRLHPQAMTTKYRKSGVVRRDLLRLTEAMLRSVTPTWFARRIAWGRVAGSFLAQAFSGVRHGYWRWPIAALGQAFLIDPWFLGLGGFLIFFRTGLLGFAAGSDRRIRICRGRTLHV
jgi:glycosyltransferase involved in cell wall biosynthesis